MILIKDCTILPMTGKSDLLECGYLVVDGQRIQTIAAGEAPGADRFDQVIEAKGMVAMPGLINAHTHCGMTLLRSYADDLPLMEWLETKIWPFESRLTEEDYYWGTMLGIVEMIKSGTTTFNDMYFCLDQIVRAVDESGIRASLARGMVGVSPDAENAFPDSRRLKDQCHGAGDGRIRIVLGPHAPYTCSPDYLKRVIALSEELDLPVHIHLAETLIEIEGVVAQHGKRPIELMESIGLFNRPVMAAHCVHLTDQEIEILARHGVGVIHNPESNMKLASGVARVPDMLKAGIPVAIGTDGAASNNNLDMLQELRSCAYLHKVNTMNPLAVPAYQALEMATVNGAKVLGLNEVGTLEQGKKADIILFDMEKPHLYPKHDVYAHIAYAALASDVDTVLVDGKVLMRERKLTTIDERRVLREAQRCAERLGE
ncbi:MAG: amidohydrolase [Solirubrobacterales bacterium]